MIISMVTVLGWRTYNYYMTNAYIWLEESKQASGSTLNRLPLFWSLREATFKPRTYHMLLNNTICMTHSFVRFFFGPSFCCRATVVSKTEVIPIVTMFYIYGISGGLREDLKRFPFLAQLPIKLKQKRLTLKVIEQRSFPSVVAQGWVES